MSLQEPKVSIIIPSYNGEKRLPKLLSSLASQTYKEFEIIIVIDGSTDNSIAILENFRPYFMNFLILRQNNRGRAGARNEGAKKANGDLLIFYDDDIIPYKNSVKQHLSNYKKYRKEVITGGNQIEDQNQAVNDFERYRSNLRKKWLQHYSEKGEFLTIENLYLTAANFSISKEIFKELNGFDESFSDAEDFEFAIRAYKKGIKIFFDKSNVAYHEDEATVRSYIKRRRQYETARKQLHSKHPDFIFPLKKTRSKRMIYFVFCFEFWVRSIEKENLTFLPRSIRYKIYTLTIWGLSQHFPNKKL